MKLPQAFEAHYHHKNMDNTMKVSFSPVGENKTRYDFEYEYTRISGFHAQFHRQGISGHVSETC